MGTVTELRSSSHILSICNLVILVVTVCGPFSAPANALDIDKSPKQCRLDRWTRRDGLPARRIEALTQTRDGYIWMATRGGVVRFDGKSFRVFNYKNTPNFFRDMAVTIAVGPRGVPWVGTDGGGWGPLSNGAFHPIASQAKKVKWSQQDAIYTARDGSVWAAGQGQFTLVHVVGTRIHAFELTTPNGRAAAGCCGITQDRAGQLWLLSWEGLHRFDSSGNLRLVEGFTDPTAIVAAPDGGLWIGTKHGLFRRQNNLTRAFTGHDGIPLLNIRSLCADRSGNLWIGTASGLGRYARGKFNLYTRDAGLPDTNVGPILEDLEGSLWVATDTGLNRFAHTKLTPIDFLAANGSSPKVGTPAEAPDGSLWFATSLGLFRVHGYESTHYGVRQGVPFDDVKSVAAARDGSLFLLNAAGDLFRYNGHHSSLLQSKRGLEMLTTDSHGTLAVGGDRVLYRVDVTGLRKVQTLPHYEWAFSCTVDSHDVLWLATTAGIIRAKVASAESFHGGLPADTHVLAVSEGSSGEMWLGTDKGLARFRDGRFRIYSVADGLPDNNIYVVQEDGEGSVWLGGTRGLFTLKLSDLDAMDSGLATHLDYTLYDDSDGVREFPVQGHQLRDRAGRMWFTGNQGVTVVDPRNLRLNLRIPTVLIERASGDNRPLDTGASESVAPATKKLEFTYTALSLIAPERVLFRYRLIGYDKSWVEAGTRRAAYYTNLPPGKYRFEVTACNNDGVWNLVGARYEFTLRPNFYQTGWFAALCVGGGLLLIWGIVALRSRHLRGRNRDLENRVTLRTAELNASVEELKQSTEMLEQAHSELQTSREELVAYNEELTAINDELETANARLEDLATTDGMTGIANHRAFQDQVRAVVARAARAESSTTLLLCDVDRFKQYNDSYGHPAGDEVLRIVARLLRENVREGDFIARYGGEEFAVLLPNTGSAEALDVATRLRAVIEEFAFAWRKVTVSIGVSAPMAGVVAPQSLVESADRALYAAKHSGRNRVVLGETETAGERREEWIAKSAAASSVADPIDVAEVAELADGLLRILNLRDAETNGHSQRVARYTSFLACEAEARGIHVFTEQERRDIELGALLHDIGKVGIPDAILYKDTALTAEEWEVMRTHPLLGAEVLRGCPHFAGAMPVVRSHHERWDGAGYPDQLHSKKIPVAARLFALSDALDAMSTNRPYREALPYGVVREEIKRMSGHQFDPTLAELFLSIEPEVWERLAMGPCPDLTHGGARRAELQRAA